MSERERAYQMKRPEYIEGPLRETAKQDLLELSPKEVDELSDDDLRDLLEQLADMDTDDRKANQLLYYEMVNPDSLAVHTSTAKTVGVGGGNGSSKTETCLVEMLMCATGILPLSLRDHVDPKQRFRGPLNCRVVCESLTTVLHPIILPKLRFEQWTGTDRPGGKRGHWGWIPQTHLIDGSWEKSWSEKLRTLTFMYRDFETGKVEGLSKIQFMSVDQDWSDFASGDYHIVLHDEPPRFDIWRENEARTMRVDGRMMLAMTWPDEPSINVDWIFDEVYEPGMIGPNKDTDIDWIVLDSEKNTSLEQSSVARQAAKWNDSVRATRIHGQPIRFSNRIHPDYTDTDEWWCFVCHDRRRVMPETGECAKCGNVDTVLYNHVRDFDVRPNWPVVWIVDPHPRKPIMWMWVQVDPSDDYWVIAEGALDSDTQGVRDEVYQLEESYNITPKLRLIDPNMGRSRSNQGQRETTWQDEFSSYGLVCDLPDDSEIGRKTINALLKPDPSTHRPRLHVHPRCANTNSQMKRFSWDEHVRSLEKEPKQKPKAKNDDYPTMLKYLVNEMPTFQSLLGGSPIIRNYMAGGRAA